jgi:hypothetical protein
VHGEVVQVDPIRPAFKAPPSNLLELKCDVPLSNFSINFNVRHYTMVSLDGDLKMWTPSSVARGGERAGWFCGVNSTDETHVESAWNYAPEGTSAKRAFQVP